MKHTKLPCNPANYIVAPIRQSLSAKAGPLEIANPFTPSGNVFDTVAENRFTYGKAKPKAWDFQGKVETPISPVERKDKRESSKHIFAFTPKAAELCCPPTLKPSNRVAVWQGDSVAKQFYVTKTDPVTKEETKFRVSMTTNTVSVLSYGQLIEFSHSTRSKGTFADMRDGKRKPLSFAKAELRRMLGATEGDKAYAALATLPPKRPTAEQPGDSAARSQGSNPRRETRNARLAESTALYNTTARVARKLVG